MSSTARHASNGVKVLLITASWTGLLILLYINSYLLIGDLIGWGRLSGTNDFWPDFWGNTVIGLVGGLVGGSFLVFSVNAGYRHKTFLSGIVRSVLTFLVTYMAIAVTVIFAMPFALYSLRSGVVEGTQRGWDNLVLNLYTPSFPVTAVLFGLVVAGTQFMLQVNDKFGPGVLWKLMTGKYYHPRDEERVFMFLDLRSSTEIAERIGHKRFFELLRELFQDVTKPVIDSFGDIYQYVGDEVVITWPVQLGIQNGNCIQCYFRIVEVLAEKREEYVERFGVVPDFKAGLHVGEATVGEIGVVKKDIVYSGDVLNTTSRIQQECNKYSVNLLASADLVRRLVLAPFYEARPLGEIRLRGKTEALGLNEVRAVAAVA